MDAFDRAADEMAVWTLRINQINDVVWDLLCEASKYPEDSEERRYYRDLSLQLTDINAACVKLMKKRKEQLGG